MRYLVLLLFPLQILVCQDIEYSIMLTARSSVSGLKFEINFEKGQTGAKIVFFQRDSIQSVAGKMDALSEFSDRYSEKRRKSKNIPFTDDEVLELDSLSRLGEFYSKDSTLIDKNHPIMRLSNLIYQTSNEELKKLEGKWLEGNTLIIDGTSVSLRIRDKKDFRHIEAQSPQKGRYSLLYNWMTEILRYYRTQNPRILKTRAETCGY